MCPPENTCFGGLGLRTGRCWCPPARENLYRIHTGSQPCPGNQALDPNTDGSWDLRAYSEQPLTPVAGMDGTCTPGRTLSICSGSAWGAVRDLSLTLGDNDADGASVGNNHMCHHLWPKAVILTRHEIHTSSQLFRLTKWIFQQPTGSQLTICVFHTRLLFHKRAGVCPEAQSLNPPGFRERLAVNQLSWETLILPIARGTHSWASLFSAHILVLLKSGQSSCWVLLWGMQGGFQSPGGTGGAEIPL